MADNTAAETSTPPVCYADTIEQQQLVDCKYAPNPNIIPPAKRFCRKKLVTQSSDPYLSEYNERYIPKPLDLQLVRAARGIDFASATAQGSAAATANKNKDHFRIAIDDNFYGKTLYTDEFKAKALTDAEKPHYCGPVKTNWERSKDAVSGLTTYHGAYTPKQGDRYSPYLPKQIDDVILPTGPSCRTLPEYLQSGAKTSYRRFKSNEIGDARPPPALPKDNNAALPTKSQAALVSFPKTTTFSDAFKAYADTRPPERIKPPMLSNLQEQQQQQLRDDAKLSSRPPNNISTYTDHYVWKAGEPPKRGRCAVATGRAGRGAQQQALAAATTAAAVEQVPTLKTAKSFKQSSMNESSCKRQIAAMECCSPHKPKMLGTTTYDTQFVAPALRGGRQSIVNFAPSKTPHVGMLWQKGQFGGHSTYQDNYIATASQTRALMRPPAKSVRDACWTAAEPSSAPDGGAATGDHQLAISSTGRNRFTTTYNTEYIPREKTQSLMNMHKQVKGKYKPVFKPDLLFDSKLIPAGIPTGSTVKFTTKDDYRSWAAADIQRGKAVIPQSDYRPNGDNNQFSDATTYGDDYVYRDGVPCKPCKPDATSNNVVVRQPNRVNSYSTLYKDTICRTADRTRGMPSDLLRFPDNTIKDNGNLIWHCVPECEPKRKLPAGNNICPANKSCADGKCVFKPKQAAAESAPSGDSAGKE